MPGEIPETDEPGRLQSMGVTRSWTQLSVHSPTTHTYTLTHIYKEKLHKAIPALLGINRSSLVSYFLRFCFFFCLFFEAGFNPLKLFHKNPNNGPKPTYITYIN